MAHYEIWTDGRLLRSFDNLKEARRVAKRWGFTVKTVRRPRGPNDPKVQPWQYRFISPEEEELKKIMPESAITDDEKTLTIDDLDFD